MPVFSLALAELESALEKGDATAAKVQADRILEAVPDLKKSSPHKNVNQRKKFVELATKLEETITLTTDQANNGNFKDAKATFKKAEKYVLPVMPNSAIEQCLPKETGGHIMEEKCRLDERIINRIKQHNQELAEKQQQPDDIMTDIQKCKRCRSVSR